MKQIGRKIMVFVLLLSCTASLYGESVRAMNKSEDRWSSDYQYCYNITCEDYPQDVLPIYESQTKHNKGIETIIELSQSKTLTSTSFDSFKASVGNFFFNMALEIGISESVSVTLGTSVGYKIPADRNSGRYRIEAVFPRSRVTFTKYRDTMEVVGRPITVPYAMDYREKYYRLNRYSD